MDYANEGSLGECLTRISKNNWKQKLYMLYKIIDGLKEIHKQGLIHCDFHDGNILNHNGDRVYISDLGLCRPIKSFLQKYRDFVSSCIDPKYPLLIACTQITPCMVAKFFEDSIYM